MTLLEALRELKKRVLNNDTYRIDRGICWNVDFLCNYRNKCSALVEVFVALGKDPQYPVNGEAKYHYHSWGYTLWVGDERLKRLALVDECIAYLEAQEVPNGSTYTN